MAALSAGHFEITLLFIARCTAKRLEAPKLGRCTRGILLSPGNSSFGISSQFAIRSGRARLSGWRMCAVLRSPQRRAAMPPGCFAYAPPRVWQSAEQVFPVGINRRQQVLWTVLDQRPDGDVQPGSSIGITKSGSRCRTAAAKPSSTLLDNLLAECAHQTIGNRRRRGMSIPVAERLLHLGAPRRCFGAVQGLVEKFSPARQE